MLKVLFLFSMMISQAASASGAELVCELSDLQVKTEFGRYLSFEDYPRMTVHVQEKPSCAICPATKTTIKEIWIGVNLYDGFDDETFAREVRADESAMYQINFKSGYSYLIEVGKRLEPVVGITQARYATLFKLVGPERIQLANFYCN